MGLTTALYNSVSGLDTTSTAISVAGDNIANINTPGFKERRAEFANVLGQSIASVGGFSQTGAGAKLQRISTVFSQGTLEQTGKGTDLAIEGGGFFMLQGNTGTSYTRAGIFNIDNNGFLVNPEGLRVQGYAIDPATGQSNGQLGDVALSTSISAPRASEVIELSVNLNAAETAIPVTPPATTAFDPALPNQTSHYRNVVNVFDSQGNPHAATMFFTKVAGNSWEVNVGLAPADSSVAPAPGDEFVVQATFNMSFDNDGVMTSPTTSTNVPFAFSGLAGNPTQNVALSFGNLPNNTSTVVATSQYSASSTTNAFVQDGFAPGSLRAVAIDSSGFITGSYSNGETTNLAQLALAGFPNVEGLSTVGNNRLAESRQSGQALVGEPETGTFGSIRSSAIEQSNVDLATQFVRLIINQRAFQANTRTVSVTNELLANLNSLGQ